MYVLGIECRSLSLCGKQLYPLSHSLFYSNDKYGILTIILPRYFGETSHEINSRGGARIPCLADETVYRSVITGVLLRLNSQILYREGKVQCSFFLLFFIIKMKQNFVRFY